MSYKTNFEPCKFCGRNDCVQLIPHGTGREKFWIVRCVVKRGGCGASVTGKTRRMAETAWNRSPSDNIKVTSTKVVIKKEKRNDIW